MAETKRVTRIPLRAGGFLVVWISLSTALFYLLSTFVLFRDTAIPVLFEVANSIPVGVNSYLVLSYIVGFLVSYAFFYRVGFDRLRSRFGEDG